MASSLLLVGASRGLGAALAAEFVSRGWHVTGTVRGVGRTALHDLADRHPGQVEIEQLDITESDQIAGLRSRLAGRRFDMLFVNAGTANHNQVPNTADMIEPATGAIFGRVGLADADDIATATRSARTTYRAWVIDTPDARAAIFPGAVRAATVHRD